LARKTDSNNPADWLFVASEDLAAIQALAAQEVAFTVCRSKLAEALEKVIKAELIRTGWFLKKTHDLDILREELAMRDSALAVEIIPLCSALAEVYFRARYPGFDFEDPDWPALRQQINAVTGLLENIRDRVTAASP
jgi:HEPN domain-containing protein